MHDDQFRMRMLLIPAVVAVMLMLTACGKKGSLYMPDEERPGQSQTDKEKRKTDKNEDSSTRTRADETP